MSISSRLSRPSVPVARPLPPPTSPTTLPRLSNHATFKERLQLKKMFAARPDLDHPSSAAARNRFDKQTKNLSTSAYKVDPNRLKLKLHGEVEE